jgi:hypothetical protein
MIKKIEAEDKPHPHHKVGEYSTILEVELPIEYVFMFSNIILSFVINTLMKV